MKFTPQDFDPGIGLADDGQELCTYIWAAKIANAKLDKWFEQSVKVYGGPDGQWSAVQRDEKKYGLISSNFVNDTHVGLLIDIQPIYKKKCEHEPEPDASLNSKFVCYKCGANLKAKWSEL